MDFAFGAFAAIVVAGYAVQTATGFGSTLICVTFGAQLLGIDEVVRLVVPISFLQTTYIAWQDRGAIAWPLLLNRVLPWMVAGMLLAFTFLAEVRSAWLGFAFGAMVFLLAARELIRLRSPVESEGGASISRPASYTALLGAGVIHGIYASGGPMLVYAIGREGLSKQAFRSTLSIVWIVLNVVLMTRFVASGVYTPDMLTRVAWLCATVPLGVVLGQWLYRRVDEHRFKLAVFALLLAAAISLIVRYSRELCMT